MVQKSYDFPAAHSMDTFWYAVDDDGHIAEFNTRESGAMPLSAIFKSGGAVAVALRSHAKVPPSTLRFDLDGQVHSAGEPHRRGAQTVYFLRDDESVRPLLERLNATPLSGTTGRPYHVERTSDEDYAALHANDNCLGCVFLSTYILERADPGIFSYEHAGGNMFAAPYGRLSIPDSPARLDDLPEIVREHVVKFPGRFADTGLLQPAEHWRSISWEPAWLATDGKTIRPLFFRFLGFWMLRAQLAASHYVLKFWPFGSRRRSWWKLW